MKEISEKFEKSEKSGKKENTAKKHATWLGRKRADGTKPALRGRKLGRRELLILLIPVLAAVAAVAVVMLLADRGSSYKLETSASQYYGGSTAVIEEGAALKRSSSGTTTLKQGRQSMQTSLPLYLSDSRSVVLPDDMIYFAPRSAECLRLVYFSEIACSAGGTVVVRHGDGTKTVDPGFLYDGKDFYLFLEPMVLSFNGYTMELPSLSYVEAVYGSHIMVFNYETKETVTEASEGNAEAKTAAGDYTISLFGDSMTLFDGTKSLLVTKPDLFDPLI